MHELRKLSVRGLCAPADHNLAVLQTAFPHIANINIFAKSMDGKILRYKSGAL